MADEVDDVLDAVNVIERRLAGTDKLVLPSVLDELAFIAECGLTEQARRSSSNAMQQLRTDRRFRPLLELPFPVESVEALADELRTRGLLPEKEVHDSMILAETSMMSCGLLLSSDEHLRGIDPQELTWLLHRFELAPPVIATPREIARKFFR
ncbi:MAG: DNA-binding protein [Gammaproteobacteria bacterium]